MHYFVFNSEWLLYCYCKMDPTTATVKEEPTASIVTFSVPPLLVPSTKPPLPRLLPKGPPPLVVRSLTNGKPLRRLAPAPVPLTVCGQILTTSAAAVPVAAQIVVPPPPASLPIVTAQIVTKPPTNSIQLELELQRIVYKCSLYFLEYNDNSNCNHRTT